MTRIKSILINIQEERTMKIAIGADKDGFKLKELIKKIVIGEGHEVLDVTTEPADDFVDSSLAVAKAILSKQADRGIMLDRYGVGSYMASNKLKGMITANVSDEYSARMTFNHNDARAIAIGVDIVGEALAISIVTSYINSHYAGGRHQVRVDMLDKML